MRVDQPGGAPSCAEHFRNVFMRVRRGVYILTEHGTELVEEIFDQHKTSKPIRVTGEQDGNTINQTKPRMYRKFLI